jgi:hypothetical protein
MKSRAFIRVIACLLIYLGVPVVASMVRNQTVASVLGIIYILLLISFGILRMIDFYRTNAGTTVLSRVFNVLFRLPLALFGFVCLVVGAAIIGSVLYNVFVERQNEYSGPRFVLGLGSLGLAFPSCFTVGSRCGPLCAAKKRLCSVSGRNLNMRRTMKSMASNRVHAVDAPITFLFYTGCHWRGPGDVHY